jgi:hypothetical protein
MSANNHFNLFIDAEISSRHDQERYSRYIDAAVAQGSIKAHDIIGIGERGTGSKPDLYVIDRQTITLVSEIGIFNKRIEVQRLASIALIARLRGTQEGFKGTDVTITANDASGEVVLKIVWGLGGPDWVEPLVMSQREHLFKVISEAMDRVSEAPVRPSVSSAPSKAGAIMNWAADVVRAAGVDITDERVEEHADMVAAGIRMFGFLKLGAPYGIDDLNKFYPSGEMPDGTPISTFDELYRHVVARVGSASLVDREIDQHLAGAWSEFVNGCRETYA